MRFDDDYELFTGKEGSDKTKRSAAASSTAASAATNNRP
jgi:hypothetical protein